MSTRSDIIVEHCDGRWARQYCHWDGYLEHNGQILHTHYNSQERAEELPKLGDLSILAPNTDKPDGHTFDAPLKGYCVAYGRDRGEKGTEAETGPDLASVWPPAGNMTEYTYVWLFQRGWHVADPDKGHEQRLTPLTDALAGIDVPKPDIKAAWGVIGHRT